MAGLTFFKNKSQVYEAGHLAACLLYVFMV